MNLTFFKKINFLDEYVLDASWIVTPFLDSKKSWRSKISSSMFSWCYHSTEPQWIRIKCYWSEIFRFRFLTQTFSLHFTDHFELSYTEFGRQKRIEICVQTWLVLMRISISARTSLKWRKFNFKAIKLIKIYTSQNISK